MKVAVVIVTYNRLTLLKECVFALKQQTIVPDRIIIVNNTSTDGTDTWLEQQEDIDFVTIPNKGGANGFYEGLILATKADVDWVWLMDDDTIADSNALFYLLDAVAKTKEEYGFYASNVLWKDGGRHLMNIQEEVKIEESLKSSFQENQFRLIRESTFVSTMFSKEAIAKAGLPIKDFFIWTDDIEYTTRMYKMGLGGILVEKSTVLHKTENNYRTDIFKDCVSNIWKYKYGIRNQLYFRKKHIGLASFYRNVFKNFVWYPWLILFKRKNNRLPFIKTMLVSTAQAVSFNPECKR